MTDALPDGLIIPDLDPLFAAEFARRSRGRATLERDVVLEECASLAGFIRHAWHVLEPTQPYVHNWHIDAICSHLEAITEGWIRRLLINVPPGAMKSLLVSVFWPAWEWGPAGKPHLRYLTTSYEQELVLRDNLKMRRLVESEWYQSLWGETVQLARDQRAKGKFENTHTGGREGRAFGSMTGGRGDRVIIDDPHSTKTAESDTERAATTTLFKEAIPTRLNNPSSSAIIIIMQRLHQGDVSGVALEMEQGYVHLRLPMEFEADNPCVTRLMPGFTWKDPRVEDGELLFPGRFPRSVVESDKRIMGQYAVAGQFQQRPTARSGGLFKVDEITIVKTVPRLTKVVRGWDFAGTKAKIAKKKGQPDWTAGGKIGRGDNGNFYILDMRRMQDTPAKVRQTVKAVASQDGSGTYITIPKDPAQAGIDQVDAYLTELAGYMVTPRAPTGDKELRATPFSVQVEGGKVYMLEGPWNADLLAEMRMFPSGKNDDQVDALSDAFNELCGIVPGQGLLDYYRQEAERAAREAAGDREEVPAEGLIGVIPPPGMQMAFGVNGAEYRVAADGAMWMHPDDARAVAGGWARADTSPGGQG